jgi:hypothetical protein
MSRQADRPYAAIYARVSAEYLLIGGRMRCGRCGRVMTNSRLPRTGVRYYRCTSYSVYLDAALRCRGNLRADQAIVPTTSGHARPRQTERSRRCRF